MLKSNEILAVRKVFVKKTTKSTHNPVTLFRRGKNAHDVHLKTLECTFKYQGIVPGINRKRKSNI